MHLIGVCPICTMDVEQNGILFCEYVSMHLCITMNTHTINAIAKKKAHVFLFLRIQMMYLCL